MRPPTIPSATQGTNEATAIRHLDLRGVPCPLSWAKAKVHLETLAPGERLQICLDDPRGARDLPRAAEAEGYVVERIDNDATTWKILVER